ncbi:hypothetical protein ARC20_01175 [Stenotrophomonas panacihumi]|uniref:Uncharacterized protein n=1 Tax=Stenotrophomonas panacihumi TaxID=676599 RepID=A0A0R0AMM9_9GAMM|nr:hypothetical protein [Stenotrophomonas panacihumi]KRG41651.1 hypothetical protein ARC20_01175 [Stenotrophomonas panacihumi]PTN53668.1 hypothetical protein C9J98_14580 [Stenotrophomonas panacihumi]
MNIALPALVVFLVLLPGFICRSQVKLAERDKLDYSPFGTVVAEGVLWSVLMHALWLGACALAGRHLDLRILLGLLSSAPAVQAEAIAQAHAQVGQIACYLVSQLLAAAWLTPLVRRLIIHWHLDQSDSPVAWLFRFRRAPWYYLLSGADFTGDEVPDLISIAAVVEVAGEPVLYVGSLVDYYCDAEGKLDRLVLEAVQRRALAKDRRTARVRVHDIAGDYFVLRYEQIMSLNVRYVRLAGTLPRSDAGILA